MSIIQMVVFDMAGTTIDEDNLVYKTLQESINAEGYNFTLQQVLAEGAGYEKRKAITKILALQNENFIDEVVDKIYTNFNNNLQSKYEAATILPQKGATDLFEQLKNKHIKVVLNTGYNAVTANLLLQKLGWQVGIQIDGLITASDVEYSRPSADMIMLAMEQHQIRDESKVAKVGDSIIDIEEGQNAGCGLTIGITTGAHTYEQLLTANPDAIINELSDLLVLL
jgi:phosphonatase-like hydrolase